MTADPIAGLRRALGQLAKVPSAAAADAAKSINDLLERQYAAGQDPYGKPWGPLKPSTLARGRRPPPLTASGAMRAGTRATAQPGAGIALAAPFPAGIHQAGNLPRMVARPILPDRGLPKAWGEALAESSRRALQKNFKK